MHRSLYQTDLLLNELITLHEIEGAAKPYEARKELENSMQLIKLS